MGLRIEIRWAISAAIFFVIFATDFAYEPSLFHWSSFTLIPKLQAGATQPEIHFWQFYATYGYDAIQYIPIAVFFMITG